MKLSNFFKTPSSWAKHCFALDSNGDKINLNEYNEEMMRDVKVRAMSLHGAIGYFFSYEREPEKRNQMINKIRSAIEQVTGKRYYIAEFNNREQTTFEDVLKVIKVAENI